MKKSFLQYLEVERGLSENTVTAYRRDVEKLERFARGKSRKLPELMASDIRNFLRQLHRQGLSLRSIARTLSATKGLYRFATAERLVVLDPTEQIESARLPRHLPHYLSLEEVDQLLDAPDTKSPAGLRDRAMLETLYATGLRVSELVSLRLEDIYLDAGYVRCLGKGRKERIVPLGRSAARWIVRYLKKGRAQISSKSGPWLFPSRLGTRMTRQRFWQISSKLRHQGWDWAEFVAPRGSTLFRHASARTRSRSPFTSTHAGPFGYRNHANLHPR